MTQKWFTAAELAEFALPDLPASSRGINIMAKRDGWHAPERKGTWWRPRADSGGGIEYTLAVLPQAARVALTLKLEPAEKRKPSDAPASVDIAARWAWFDQQSDKKKKDAHLRLVVLNRIRDLTNAGTRKTDAVAMLAAEIDTSASTIYQWEKLVHRVERHDWLPFLASHHAGGKGPRAECSDDAWEAFKSFYLKPEKRTIAYSYELTRRVAVVEGWVLPSEKTMARRVQALPFDVVTLARGGEAALARAMPSQQRDRSTIHAMEVWNADFHKWDVWVQWPGQKSPIRPQMMALQDIHSGKILAWRFDVTPNKHAVRLCIGDAVEAFGVPNHIILDNGKEFASKWITGQVSHRHRFKFKDEEPTGLLVQLGVEIHWAQVYHGQSKPIERAFRDLAQRTAKHPDFHGAYTGNAPQNKPSNYGERAVPHDVFLRRVDAEIAEHNAQIGRTGGVCAGRSFNQVFAESYATSVIRKVSPEQRALWLMAAEGLAVDRQEGVLTLEGNRFRAAFLDAHRGKKLVVRFDPQCLQDDLRVYRLDGAFLGMATCILPVGFMDKDAANEWSRQNKRRLRAAKDELDAVSGMSAAKLTQLMPDARPEPPPRPEARVVRMVTGNTALEAQPDELPEQSEAERQWVRGMRAQQGLRVVTGSDD